MRRHIYGRSLHFFHPGIAIINIINIINIIAIPAIPAMRPAAIPGVRAQEERGDTLLEPGKTIEREIGGEEEHFYRVTLEAGEFLRAVFNQRGVNLVITIYGPDGAKIADIDSPVGAQGAEPVSLVAEASGSFRIGARPWQKRAPRGRYEVKIEELRAAAPEDAIRVSAERVFAEATLISGEGNAQSLRRAIGKYGEAIPLYQKLGDRRQEAFVLSAIGHTHRRLGEHKQALDYYNRALALSEAAQDRIGEGLALYSIGAINDVLGEPRRALDFYERALLIYRATGDRSMEAATLGNMGVVRSGLGEQEKALGFFKEALRLKRALGDPYGEATLLNNIGLVHNYLGEKQQALEFYNRALPIYRALDDRSGEATTLNNLGSLHSELGEYDKALEFLLRVLEIKRATGNRLEEAIALNNIGVAYGNLNKPEKALEYYHQALPLSRGAGANSLTATTLNNIGKALSDSGDHRKALGFYDEALPLRRSIGDRRGEATTLNNIGRAHHDLGERQKALDFYNQALSLRRAVTDRSGEAVTLYNIASLERDLGNLAEARSHIETALAIIESLRSKVASRGLRTSYLASVQNYYELAIEILMRLERERPAAGSAAAALETSERARARTLIDLLSEIRADIRQGVPAELIERERALERMLDAKATAQMRLLGGRHTPEQAAAVAREIAALASEYEQVQTEIRQRSPRFAALTAPVPLDIGKIQTEVLDADTLLLEYSLGEEKSYLWAVTPESIRSFELPGRARIEAAAQRVYEALTARSRTLPGEGPVEKRRRVERSDAEFPQAAADLSRMILGPAAAQLGTKRLLIVSDGMLQYVPFAALPAPGTAGRASSSPAAPPAASPAAYEPLIVGHEVVSLPSASVLSVLRRETEGRGAAPKTLAVLADPVFRSDDPRVRQIARRGPVASEESSSTAEAQRSAAEAGLADFVRLRFSRQEARDITRLVPEQSRLEALDFAASRSTATSADLDQYRIVHFATHGLINNLHPELSGIVLSMVDEQGRPQNGFLRLYEIFNLKLGADLVVLSACQTAVGKEVRGEGLIGLTRGFMHAGAPRVVASLWRVDDAAAAELMKRFYQRMLGEGLRPAAALRAAQVSMWKERRWRAAHYWAAYTFQGEWK